MSKETFNTSNQNEPQQKELELVREGYKKTANER